MNLDETNKIKRIIVDELKYIYELPDELIIEFLSSLNISYTSSKAKSIFSKNILSLNKKYLNIAFYEDYITHEIIHLLNNYLGKEIK